MFKFFKRANKVDFEAEFNAMNEEKIVGKFYEWNYKKGVNKVIEFTAKQEALIGAWICEANESGNNYRVEYCK